MQEKKGMAALAAETSGARPSPAVEGQLRRAFRARQMRRRIPYAAIAASVMLFACSAWLMRSGTPPLMQPVEAATDFIAIAGSDPFEPVESPILVRVTLPRTAMMKFGLPMNAERATEFVEADVVLGYDGMARAIRFVQ